MFGIDLWDASLVPALVVAGLGGILSFLSPCVLPIVPPYLAYMAGASMEDVAGGRAARANILRAAVFFVLGLSTVFLMLGMAASAVGRILLIYQREMAIVAGLVIMLFGLHFLGLLRIPILYREARFAAQSSGGPIGAYVLGLAFAFGWTPCIGPVLAAILAVAAAKETVLKGAGLLAVYSAGLGIPFLIAAFAIEPFAAFMTRFKRHLGTVEKVMGVLLVFTGIAFLTGWITTASFWLLELFPSLANIG